MIGPIRGLADDLLEISVIGSFTNLGIRARRSLYGWKQPAQQSLRGRTVLVTGPTSGLGRQATIELAALGARVVLLGRSADRLEALRAELEAHHHDDRFPVVVADTSSLASVAEAVDRISATEARLDVLVDNAGAIYPDRRETPDGIEATLAVLVVGPFALISGLLPLLGATPGSRVIAMSSGGMYTQALDLDDLNWERRPFSGPRAYAHGKRAQVVLIREWARRYSGSGVGFVSMHPGWADTPGLSASLPGFADRMGPLLRTASEGVDSLVWLATLPSEAVASLNGAFVHDRRRRPYDRVPATRVSAAERRRLWDEVMTLSGG